MDLKQYFKKIRDVEAGLTEQDVLVISLDTSDGGKAGTISEVPKKIAARMIVEGAAALASDAEKEQFREHQERSRQALERAEMAKRVQVAILSESDLAQNLSGKRGTLL